MRPKIKQKRIDPRYFLNETVDREESLQEIEPNPSPFRPSADELEEFNVGPTGKRDEELEEIEPNPSPFDVGPVGKRDDDGHEKNDKNPNRKGKQRYKPNNKDLILGEKELYEKIRSAIEEVLSENFEDALYEEEESLGEEVDISSIALRKKKGGYTKMTKKEIAAEKARAKKRGMYKRVKPGWPWNKEEKL